VEAWHGRETCHVTDFVTFRTFIVQHVQGLEGQGHRDAAEQVAPRRSDSASCAIDEEEEEEEQRKMSGRNEDRTADSSRGNIAPARRRRASSRASRSESSSTEPGSSAREMESARSGEKNEWSSLISSLERMQLSVKKLASVREKGDGRDDDVAETDYQRAEGRGSFGDGAISSPVGKLDFSFLSDDGIHEHVRYPPVSPGGASTEFSESDYCDTAKRLSQSVPSRHRIDVRNFPFDFEVGEKKDTAPFQLCGDDWFLRLYPGGFSRETDRFVGVFLCYAGTNVPVTVNYSVTAVVEGSHALRSLGFQGKTFTKRCQGRGWDVFVKRESLRAQSPAGCFSLIVEMDPHEACGGLSAGVGDENAELDGRDQRSKDIAGVGRGNVMARGLGAEKCSVKGGASGKAVTKGGNSRAMWKPRAKPGALRRL